MTESDLRASGKQERAGSSNSASGGLFHHFNSVLEISGFCLDPFLAHFVLPGF